MERMHKRLTPIVSDWSVNKKLPPWVKIDRSLIPNVLAKDPFEMPVVEVMAAEFTDSDVHTANSISMRFPRIVKIRDDKSPKEATTLKELMHLYEESKSGIHIDELNKLKNESQSQNDELNPLKRKKSDVGETSEIKKQKKKDEGDEDNLEKIFKDFLLFKSTHLTKDEIDGFESMGGRLTSNFKKANLVLYDEKEVKGSLDDFRNRFQVTCKHYQKSWLIECLRKKALEKPIKYFVVLCQS